MAILILIAYYLAPTVVALLVVAWASERLPLHVPARSAIFAVLVAISAAPVAVYEGCVVPAWIYFIVPSLKADWPYLTISLSLAALIAFVVLNRLERAWR